MFLTLTKHARSLTQSDSKTSWTWNPKFFLRWVVGQDILVRQDKIKHEDPQLAPKKTLVSAWSAFLDPGRLKDVRGLAADGSSETQGLLKMKVSLCWAVVVL